MVEDEYVELKLVGYCLYTHSDNLHHTSWITHTYDAIGALEVWGFGTATASVHFASKHIVNVGCVQHSRNSA